MCADGPTYSSDAWGCEKRRAKAMEAGRCGEITHVFIRCMRLSLRRFASARATAAIGSTSRGRPVKLKPWVKLKRSDCSAAIPLA